MFVSSSGAGAGSVLRGGLLASGCERLRQRLRGSRAVAFDLGHPWRNAKCSLGKILSHGCRSLL